MQLRRLPPIGPIFPDAEMEARRHLSESLGRFFLREFPHHADPKLQFPPEHHANVKKDWILRFLHLIMNVDLRDVERYMADDVDGRLAVLQYVSEPWRDRTDVPGPHPAQTYERLVFVQTEMDRQADIAVLRLKKEARGELRTREETPAPRLKRGLYRKRWDENESQLEDYDVDDDYNEESPAPETLKMPERQPETTMPFDVLEISDSSSEESPSSDDIIAPAHWIEKETPQVADDSPEYSPLPYIPTPPEPETEAETISVYDTWSEGSPRARIPQAPSSEEQVSESNNDDDDDDDLVYLGESRLSYGGKRLPRKVPDEELTDSSELAMASEQTRLSYGGKRLPRRVPEDETMSCLEATMAPVQHGEGLPSENEYQHVDPVPLHLEAGSVFSLNKDSVIEELDKLFKSSQEHTITARHSQAEDTIAVSNVIQSPDVHLQDIPIGIAASNGPVPEPMVEIYYKILKPISPKRQFEQQVTSNARSEPGPPTTPPPTRTRMNTKTTATPWTLAPQQIKRGSPPQKTPDRPPVVKMKDTLAVTVEKQQTPVTPSAFYPQQRPSTLQTQPSTLRGNLGVRGNPFHLATAVKLTTQPLTNKPPRHEFSPEQYPDMPRFTPINISATRGPVGYKREMQEDTEHAGPRLKIGRRILTPDEVQTVINAPSTDSSLASEPDDSIIIID